MPLRTDITTKVLLNGQPYSIFLVDNPTIDDVLAVEMRLYAAELMNGVSQDANHRVSRDVRDVLIRLGVER
jgi:hypothetical protein